MTSDVPLDSDESLELWLKRLNKSVLSTQLDLVKITYSVYNLLTNPDYEGAFREHLSEQNYTLSTSFLKACSKLGVLPREELKGIFITSGALSVEDAYRWYKARNEPIEETISMSSNELIGSFTTDLSFKKNLTALYPKNAKQIDRTYRNTQTRKLFDTVFKPLALRIYDHRKGQPYNIDFKEDFGPHCIFNLPKCAVLNSMRGKCGAKTFEQILNNWDTLVALELSCAEADDHSAPFVNKWWTEHVTKTTDTSKIVDINDLIAQAIATPAPVTKTARVGQEIAPIVVYGVEVWNEQSSVPYDIAWNTYKYWHKLDQTLKLSDTKPSSRGRFYMSLNCYFNSIAQQGSNNILQAIGEAMMANPDKERQTHAAREHVI